MGKRIPGGSALEWIEKRFRRNAGAIKLSVDSRQRMRLRLRERAFKEINEKYGPEPRRARRGIALAIARRWWRERPTGTPGRPADPIGKLIEVK